jgi:uncharacterized cupredoxin-like copper-binding protein
MPPRRAAPGAVPCIGGETLIYGARVVGVKVVSLRTATAVPVLLLVSLALAGCAGSSDGGNQTAAGGAGAVEPTGNLTAPLEVYLTATDLGGYGYPQSWYKIRPAEPTVATGTLVNLTFKNALGNQDEHNLIVDGLDISFDALGPGERANVTFVASDPGTYAFYCDIGNHRELGMEGALTIG